MMCQGNAIVNSFPDFDTSIEASGITNQSSRLHQENLNLLSAIDILKVSFNQHSTFTAGHTGNECNNYLPFFSYSTRAEGTIQVAEDIFLRQLNLGLHDLDDVAICS
jgi:hypothetical protein